MNVTNKGYFTTQYLAEHTQKEPVYEPQLPDLDGCKFNEYRTIAPRQRYFYKQQSTATSPNMSTTSFSIPTSPISDISFLSEPPQTPTQILQPNQKYHHQNISPKQLKSDRTGEESIYLYANETNSGTSSVPDSPMSVKPFDPDDLTEEITPAQLNYLQQPTNIYYSSQYSHQPGINESNLSSTTTGYRNISPVLTKTNLQPANTQYEGYYIEQKQRYDNSEIKPKLYTHKTFHDVFNNKQELTDIYNPIEFVFKSKSENNVTHAFNNLRAKIGKDNYNDYDYYKTKANAKAKSQEVFVSNASDDEEGGPNSTPFDGAKANKKKPFKKLFRTKLKRVKKLLAQDFIDNTDKQLDLHSQLKSGQLDFNNTNLLAPATNKPIDKPTEKIANPKNTPWNKFVSSVPFNGTKLTKEKAARNWKSAISKFNSPTAILFKEESSKKQIIVEADDETVINKELFYNPVTKQLQPCPPNEFDLGNGLLARVASHPWIEPYYLAVEPTIVQYYPTVLPYAIRMHPTNFTNSLKCYDIFNKIFSPLDKLAEIVPILTVFVHFIEQLLFFWIAWESYKITRFIFHILYVLSSPFQKNK